MAIPTIAGCVVDTQIAPTVFLAQIKSPGSGDGTKISLVERCQAAALVDFHVRALERWTFRFRESVVALKELAALRELDRVSHNSGSEEAKNGTGILLGFGPKSAAGSTGYAAVAAALAGAVVYALYGPLEEPREVSLRIKAERGADRLRLEIELLECDRIYRAVGNLPARIDPPYIRVLQERGDRSVLLRNLNECRNNIIRASFGQPPLNRGLPCDCLPVPELP